MAKGQEGSREGEVVGWVDEVSGESVHVTIKFGPNDIEFAEIPIDKFRPEDRPELHQGTIFYVDTTGATNDHRIRLLQAKWTQEMLDKVMRKAEYWRKLFSDWRQR